MPEESTFLCTLHYRRKEIVSGGGGITKKIIFKGYNSNFQKSGGAHASPPPPPPVPTAEALEHMARKVHDQNEVNIVHMLILLLSDTVLQR